MDKTIFIIPSVIEFVDNPLSYSKTRSIFTAQQRAQQTVRTVASIRRKMPHAEIVLIEMGLRDAPQHLQQLVNHYLFLGNRKFVREAVDGPYKGYGEAIGLWLANRILRRVEADYYFKISGRYCLDDNFDITVWKDAFVCKAGPGWISTRLYGFPKNTYDSWRKTLRSALPFLLQGEAIENTLWRLLPDFKSIDTLGVSGLVAPWDQRVSE